MSFEVGDKVWSPRYGEGIVSDVCINNKNYLFPITVEFQNRTKCVYTYDCKENPDDLLSTLFHAGTRIIAAPEPDRKQPKPTHEFKPFDKVLVRDNEDDVEWMATLFSQLDLGIKHFPFVAINTERYQYQQCIPYEGNEHLLGTTDAPEEK
jgi:hypothetical protein